ncbi:MAG: hypothetical protein AAGK74_07490, partial [Chloroflexota bacterium]
VQGISRDNCANDDATLAAIRFPAVGSGNSRKLCSRSVGENPIRDGSEVWSSCLTGSTNNSGSSGPVEVVGITHVDITNGGSGELEQDEELEESTWEFTADLPPDDGVGSVAFTLVELDTNGDVIDTVYANNVDSDNSPTPAGGGSFEATAYAGVALTEGSYRISATPYSGANLNGTMGTTFSRDFTIAPPAFLAPEVTGFTLRDFDNGSAADIQNNESYTQSTFNIRVNVSGSHDSIRWSLSGPSYATSNQQITDDPYWIFGVTDTNPNQVTDIVPGNYTLTAIPFDADNNGYTPETISFTIEAQDETFKVQEFRLYNATNDVDQGQIEDGDTLTLSSTEDFVTFVAVVDPNGPTQSVALRLTGPVSENRVEGNNGSLYAVFGDTGSDLDGKFLSPGQYTLEATPWSGANASGTPGIPLEISFTVIEPDPNTGPVIDTFFLVDVSDSSNLVDRRVLTDGDTINLNEVTYNWNIRAAMDPQTVDNVSFTMTGDRTINPGQETEFVFPYHLPGDSDPLNMGVGNYTITAIGTDDGVQGPPRTINLTVTQEQQTSCSTPEIVPQLIQCNADGYWIGTQFRTSCGADTEFAWDNDVEARQSESFDGTVWASTWQGVWDPNMNQGSLASVCANGDWDPLGFTVTYPDGVEKSFSVDLTAGTLTGN